MCTADTFSYSPELQLHENFLTFIPTDIPIIVPSQAKTQNELMRLESASSNTYLQTNFGSHFEHLLQSSPLISGNNLCFYLDLKSPYTPDSDSSIYNFHKSDIKQFFMDSKYNFLSLSLDCGRNGKRARKRYRCKFPGCFKDYSTSGHMNRHFNSHVGLKPYTCKYAGCGRMFSRHDNMLSHERTVHQK